MVRATFAGFTTAISALQANQKRLDITGQNLANMNTVGYTRQQLQVSSVNYRNPISHYMNGSEISVGFGVHMDTVAQIRDPFMDIQYRNQMQKSGYTNALQISYDRLAEFFDESHIDGIRQAFDNIQDTLEKMSNPAMINDPIYETHLRTQMQALTNLLNQGAEDIERAKMEEYNRLDGTGTSEQGAIQRVNDILQQVGALNRRIKENQIHGQPSLELMDERNVLIDELSSYIPIEVTYKKDAEHDGFITDAAGNIIGEDLSETYHLDSSGRPIMKKEWPDDLYINMKYKDENGVLQNIELVSGTEGAGEENHMKLVIPHDKEILDTTDKTYGPGDVSIEFYELDAEGNPGAGAGLLISKDKNEFPDDCGSIQAGLDMLWKGGDPGDDVRGYDYYMNELDTLAKAFSEVMNTLNTTGEGDPDYILFINKTTNTAADITAANIGISQDWISGKVHISKKGENANDTVMNMLASMTATYPYDKFKNDASNIILDDIDLDNNSFANYMNHVSTVLANDSYSNQNALKTNVTVLNGIQNSRASVSGVSLDEEASNMMMYMSAYSAASRLMTTLDQALDVLINGTGVVGR